MDRLLSLRGGETDAQLPWPLRLVEGARWLRKKHPKSTWRWIWRRYGLGGRPQEADLTLYNPAKVAVIRYRFRGNKIASPWNDVDSRAPGHRRLTFDETEFLGRVEESLAFG